MILHPRNSYLTCRFFDEEEETAHGIQIVRGDKNKPFSFGIVGESGPDSENKTNDIICFSQILAIPVLWLDSEFVMVSENQVLALVEIEKDDGIKGEKWEDEHPDELTNDDRPRIIDPRAS